MGGIVSLFTGGKSDAEKRAERRAAQAEEQSRINLKRIEDQRLADKARNDDRQKRLDKQKAEQDIIANDKKKRLITRSSGRNRNIFTSPLGLETETLA